MLGSLLAMYIKEFQIRNFRGINKMTLFFNKGLNVLIGENNTGKTTVLDALRLCLSIGNSKREIFLSPGDFFRNSAGAKRDTIEFDLTFVDLTDKEKGIFIDLLAKRNDEMELQLHVRYLREIRHGIEKIRLRYWGGENEGQNITPEIMELLYFVYLGALRDADRDLAPGKGNRLGELFLKFAGDESKQEEYASRINEKLRSDGEWQKLIKQAKGTINEHLKKTTIQNVPQSVEVKFLPLNFKKIAESLKIFIPIIEVNKTTIVETFEEDEKWKDFFKNPESEKLTFKMDFLEKVESDVELDVSKKQFLKKTFEDSLFEVSQNGLGYNNLIYIATVLGDLIERKKMRMEFYIALIIEEPEAHLHPQLQDILFNFFKEIEETGRIQIFISSHSPTITAKSKIDVITALQRENDKFYSVSLSKFDLAEDHKRYLERFLDVTKCQLFFAKGVVLVEGISESLLLPVMVDKIGARFNLDKNAIEVINIGGVSFEPFARLFNSMDIKRRLNYKCAILTDDDRSNGQISARAQRAIALEAGLAKVFLAERTFEYELFKAGNSELLIRIYKEMHPQFNLEYQAINAAMTFVAAIKRNKDKAEFAQLLALKLQENPRVFADFKVPPYIENSVNWMFENRE